MEIINGLHNIAAKHIGNVITLGNFDGVHRGHQMLLDALCAKGKELGVPSALITFEPQPREFFAGTEVPPRLTRLREKVRLLEETGLDRMVLLPFNERTAQIPAEWIIEVLLHKMLGARYVVVGDDFHFGRDREGNFAMMQRAGERLGFEVGSMSTLQQGDMRISSTLVRQALAEADFEKANALLGHEYFIMGRVVYGRQLGRQLGVPTANIRLQRYKAALEGVYCVLVEGIGGEVHHGIANIGVRPTLEGKEPLLEVHVFDYCGNLYGQLLTVKFQLKLRDERAFESIDALKTQIDADLITARAYFAEQS
ncbi:MAG: riboflavin kinase/FMN adenylyltransferase [Candidatus Azotimanducaceae bacterium]|jgi:riboflavin kinase/FMN adenylyltransferase